MLKDLEKGYLSITGEGCQDFVQSELRKERMWMQETFHVEWMGGDLSQFCQFYESM
jgi:hypothetical protein